MWALALFPLSLAILSFVSALKPKWPIHWGRRNATGARVSVAGRIVAGIFFLNSAILAAIVTTHIDEIKAHAPTPPLYGFLFVVNFLLLFSMFPIYLRDKQNSKSND